MQCSFSYSLAAVSVDLS